MIQHSAPLGSIIQYMCTASSQHNCAKGLHYPSLARPGAPKGPSKGAPHGCHYRAQVRPMDPIICPRAALCAHYPARVRTPLSSTGPAHGHHYPAQLRPGTELPSTGSPHGPHYPAQVRPATELSSTRSPHGPHYCAQGPPVTELSSTCSPHGPHYPSQVRPGTPLSSRRLCS